jgi:CHASE3 domain sensor protein
MQWLRNLPVSRKFIAAFGIVCGLCIALGIYTFTTTRNIAVKSADVSENGFPSVIQLGEIRSAIATVRRSDLAYMLCVDSACKATYAAKRQKALAALPAAVKVYEPLICYPGEREILPEIHQRLRAIHGNQRSQRLFACSRQDRRRSGHSDGASYDQHSRRSSGSRGPTTCI